MNYYHDEYPDHTKCGRLCATVSAAQSLSQTFGQAEYIGGLARQQNGQIDIEFRHNGKTGRRPEARQISRP